MAQPPRKNWPVRLWPEIWGTKQEYVLWNVASVLFCCSLYCNSWSRYSLTLSLCDHWPLKFRSSIGLIWFPQVIYWSQRYVSKGFRDMNVSLSQLWLFMVACHHQWRDSLTRTIWFSTGALLTLAWHCELFFKKIFGLKYTRYLQIISKYKGEIHPGHKLDLSKSGWHRSWDVTIRLAYVVSYMRLLSAKKQYVTPLTFSSWAHWAYNMHLLLFPLTDAINKREVTARAATE